MYPSIIRQDIISIQVEKILFMSVIFSIFEKYCTSIRHLLIIYSNSNVKTHATCRWSAAPHPNCIVFLCLLVWEYIKLHSFLNSLFLKISLFPLFGIKYLFLDELYLDILYSSYRMLTTEELHKMFNYFNIYDWFYTDH